MVHGDKPSEALIDKVQPPHDVDDLPIYEGAWCRNVAGAEPSSTVRLARGGPLQVTLVGVERYWDGGADGAGTPSHYVMLWPEFKTGGSRWRLKGVSIQAFEAARVAKDMLANKPSNPSRREARREGGKDRKTDGSALLGAPVGESYLLYVRHMNQAAHWVRSRGVEILANERAFIASMLQGLAAKKE